MTQNWTQLLDTPHINLADCLVQRHLREGRGPRTAILHEEGSVTYDALWAGIAASAQALRDRGVGQGDKVLLVIPDSVAFVTAFYAVLALGAAAVLANPLLAAEDLAYMVRHVGAKFGIAHRPLVSKLENLKASGLDVIACGNGALERDEFENMAGRYDTNFVPAVTSASDLAYVLFSSGTTGKPKAIPRRHRDILHCARAFGDDILGMTEQDVLLAVPKLTFGYALGGALLFAGVAGSATVVFPQRSLAPVIAQQLLRFQPTVFLGTPRIVAGLLKTGQLKALQSVRIASSAGESLPPSVLKDWEARLSAPLIDGFGSTEVGHIFLSNRPHDTHEGSCGRCLSEFRVKLIDDKGQTVGDGRSGRMCIAGPSVAQGYLNDPERSAEAFQGEWHVSNDLFTCHDGIYTYVGRSDDMVKKGCGEWISPYELEDELLKLPFVLESVVVGSRNANGVIGLKAFVVVTPQTPVSDALVTQLIDHSRNQWPDFPHKHLDEVEFIGELPRNAAGKVQRRLLRQETLTEFSYDC